MVLELQPQLTIRVEISRSRGMTALEYVLDSPASAADYHHLRVPGPTFRGSPQEFQRRLLGRLETLRRQSAYEPSLNESDVEGEVVDMGQDLFRKLFDGEMERIYRRLPDSVETLLITSEEPYIPWELLHDGEDFLCFRFRMGRWLAGRQAPALHRAIENVSALRALADDANWDELELLHRLYGSEADLRCHFVQDATFQVLRKALHDDDFDLLHFSGHGEHDLGDLDPVIVAQDRPFRPLNVSETIRARLKLRRPFIFLNSCQVGRVGLALTGLEGWAPTWIESGCAGFLAPAWPVSAGSAYAFAESFYGGLDDGLDLGSAVQAARRDLREKNVGELGWLAYVLYGTPRARLTFGTVDEPTAADPKDPEPATRPRSGKPRTAAPRTNAAQIDDRGPDRGPGVQRSSTPPSTGRMSGSSPGVRRWRRALAAGLVGALLAAGIYFWWAQQVTETGKPPVKQHLPEPEPSTEPEGVGPMADAPPRVVETVAGRVAVLATRQLDPSLRAIFRRSLQEIEGIEPLMVDGLYPSYSPGLAARGWGAQYYLFVGPDVQEIGAAISNIKSVSLSLDGVLVDPRDGTVIKQFSETHTGAGGSTDAALRQAAERCLEEITDNLRERTQS